MCFSGPVRGFARKYHWLGIVEKMGFPLLPAPLGFLHEFDSTP